VAGEGFFLAWWSGAFANRPLDGADGDRRRPPHVAAVVRLPQEAGLEQGEQPRLASSSDRLHRRRACQAVSARPGISAYSMGSNSAASATLMNVMVCSLCECEKQRIRRRLPHGFGRVSAL
jgi:hypothetical protein